MDCPNWFIQPPVVVHSTPSTGLNEPPHHLFLKFYFSTHDNDSTNLHSLKCGAIILLDINIKRSFSYVDDKDRHRENEKVAHSTPVSPIISKPYAYLQTMTKTSVNFRKNRHKNVGGQKDGRKESQRLRPSDFLRKGGGQ